MSLKDEIDTEVKKIFQSRWTTRKGTVVPAAEDIGLGNDAIEYEEATVLYADLSGSTSMVDGHDRLFAGEVYKAYLYAAARVIRNEGGEITAYDGDRIMAVFLGSTKNTSATIAGLKINYAVKQIVNPALHAQYPAKSFAVRHVVGIDTSSQLVARTGVRGDNDLVWVGRSANYAAKLTTLPADYPTWITEAVFKRLRDDARYGGNPRALMWERRLWTAMSNLPVYRSNWWWVV